MKGTLLFSCITLRIGVYKRKTLLGCILHRLDIIAKFQLNVKFWYQISRENYQQQLYTPGELGPKISELEKFRK